MPTPFPCPDLNRYQRLAAGQLVAPETETLLDHLETCPVCAERIERFSDRDMLVELIHLAQTQRERGADVVVARLVDQLRVLRPPGTKSALPAPAGLREDRHSAGNGTDSGSSPPSCLDPHLRALLAPAQAPGELGRLGPYRILKVLGVGGMGVVFQAEDSLLQRLVAVKALLPHLIASEAARQRFLREARAAAALKHDHIVTIHQVGEDRGVPYLAMEFLDGESLNDRLQREGQLPVPEVLRIGREMAEGLAAAHERGLIHRDIKPANLWLEKSPASPGRHSGEDRVKILDFGLARVATEAVQLTQSGVIVGTPAYLAPEQMQGQQVGPRSDLFSLGCVLYQVATGEAPFQGTDMFSTLLAVATASPAPPVSRNLELPPELSDFVLQLLAKDPQDRPESAQVVAETLDRMAHAELPPKIASIDPCNINFSRPGFNYRGLLAVVALTLSLLISLGVWLLRGESKEDTPSSQTDAPGVVVKSSVVGGATALDEKVGRASQLQQGHVGNRASSHLGLPAPWSRSSGPDGGRGTGYVNGLGMEFALIPKGTAWLGGGGGQPGERAVEFKEDFYLSVYPVTQELWDRLIVVKAGNPSWFSRKGPGQEAVADIPDATLKRFPVENISWYECRQFIANLNLETNETGWIYRIPTEAEWEYACRGGPMADRAESAFDFYLDCPTNQLLPEQAHFGMGEKGRPSPVGSHTPNRLGLHDLHGNVRAWCDDEVPNPKQPSASSLGVIRGGSYCSLAEHCRAAARFLHPHAHKHPGCGLRVVRLPVAIKPGTVWAGHRFYQKGAYAPATVRYELHVHERDGPKFKGHVFDNGPGRNHAKIEGEIQGDAIQWREWPGHMPQAELRIQGKLQGDTIRLQFQGKYGPGGLTNEGEGQLKMSSRVQK